MLDGIVHIKDIVVAKIDELLDKRKRGAEQLTPRPHQASGFGFEPEPLAEYDRDFRDDRHRLFADTDADVDDRRRPADDGGWPVDDRRRPADDERVPMGNRRHPPSGDRRAVSDHLPLNDNGHRLFDSAGPSFDEPEAPLPPPKIRHRPRPPPDGDTPSGPVLEPPPNPNPNPNPRPAPAAVVDDLLSFDAAPPSKANAGSDLLGLGGGDLFNFAPPPRPAVPVLQPFEVMAPVVGDFRAQVAPVLPAANFGAMRPQPTQARAMFSGGPQPPQIVRPTQNNPFAALELF
jgi:hypothetical protein